MSRVPFQAIARQDVTEWPATKEPSTWTPGDFVLTHGGSAFSKLIRFGQSLRIHGEDRKYIYWSHAVLVASDTGDLIEANKPGVISSHVRDYRDVPYVVVHTGASDADRVEVVAFARWCLDHHTEIGRLNFFSLGLSMLTGSKLSFFVDGETTCSGLVARAQERTGAIFNRATVNITPADLAKYYRV